jgi:hypothetical protein
MKKPTHDDEVFNLIDRINQESEDHFEFTALLDEKEALTTVKKLPLEMTLSMIDTIRTTFQKQDLKPLLRENQQQNSGEMRMVIQENGVDPRVSERGPGDFSTSAETGDADLDARLEQEVTTRLNELLEMVVDAGRLNRDDHEAVERFKRGMKPQIIMSYAKTLLEKTHDPHRLKLVVSNTTVGERIVRIFTEGVADLKELLAEGAQITERSVEHMEEVIIADAKNAVVALQTIATRQYMIHILIEAALR